ncbi:MAG: PQQ-dependent sugar dehydrogenase [Chthoniobacterales bacterium]
MRPSYPHLRAAILAVTFALATAIIDGVAQTSDPFPNPIARTTFVAEIADFAIVPGTPGAARISVLTASPDGRIFANDQNGPLFQISTDGRRVTTYLNLANTPGVDLRSNGEQGFQSFAFHPQFSTPGTPGYGKFYTAHTSSNLSPPADFTPGGGTDAGDHVILEWSTSNPETNRFIPADPASPHREVLRIEGPYGNHTMGLIAFNPNARPASADYGLLYVAMGDGGSGGDPLGLAQNPANPYGTILRINPLGSDSANGRYGIPPGNPFVGNASGLDEVYAYGLRNPQRFFWDTGGSRRLFIADIGQAVIEEINVGAAGANYGWARREGSFPYRGGKVGTNSRSDFATTGYTYPIAEYDHSEGAAVTVGPVERTGLIPNLAGRLLFADFPRGRIFLLSADALPSGGPSGITELRISYQGRERTFQSIINDRNPTTSRSDLRFGSDLSGRIFLLNKKDNVIRVLTATPVPLGPRPVVRIRGRNQRVTTSNRRINLRGIARDTGPIARVEIRNVRLKRRFFPVGGAERWKAKVRLRPGRNAIRVRAIDADDRKSRPDKIVVLKR